MNNFPKQERQTWHDSIQWFSFSVFFCMNSMAIQQRTRTATLTFKWKITKIVLVMSLKHTPVTQSILCLIFLRYSEEESKNNLQFMILTYMWPWNKVKLIKSDIKCWNLSKAIITKFDRPPLNSVCKKAKIKGFLFCFLNQKTCPSSPLNKCKSEK